MPPLTGTVTSARGTAAAAPLVGSVRHWAPRPPSGTASWVRSPSSTGCYVSTCPVGLQLALRHPDRAFATLDAEAATPNDSI